VVVHVVLQAEVSSNGETAANDIQFPVEVTSRHTRPVVVLEKQDLIRYRHDFNVDLTFICDKPIAVRTVVTNIIWQFLQLHYSVSCNPSVSLRVVVFRSVFCRKVLGTNEYIKYNCEAHITGSASRNWVNANEVFAM